MPSLADIRAKLPQIRDLSDGDALTFIQKAYYPDRTTDELGAALGVEPPKPPGPNQFTSGLKRSFAELPGLAAGVGAYAADVVGADSARDSMLAYAKKSNDEVAQAHQGDASSLTDTWDGKTGWLDFLKNSSGYVAGQALQSIATGGMGALGAKMLAKQGAKEIAEAAAAKAIAGGASEEVAKQASIKALADATSKSMQAGAVVGAGAHNFGMELGSIYPDAVETAGGADKLDAEDKFRVFAAASLAAGVDTAGEAILASRVLKGSKAAGGNVLGRAAREVPAGMAREGATEAIQTGIEHYGAGQPIADEKGLRDIIDSAGVGMVGGGLGGGAASLRARSEIDAQAHQQLATATNVGDMISAANAIASVPLDIPTSAPIPTPSAPVSDIPPEGSAGVIAQTPVQRVDSLRTQLQDPQVREQIREKLGPDALGTLGYYATQATRSDIPAATAERMLGLAEMIVSRAVLQPLDQPQANVPQQAIGARQQDLLDMEQGPALVGADTQPTGTMRVNSAGVAMPETGIERTNARQASRQEDEAQATAAAEAASLGTQARKASAVNADLNVKRPAPPVLMPERRRTDGIELQPVEPADPVASYLDRVRAVNTPQARAFVQDFNAGRITRQDVIRVMQSQDADPLTPTQRIEQAAAQTPKPADGIQTARVYRSRSAAFVESRKTGGTVEPVQGGFIVKEPSNVEPDVAGTAGLSPAASDGRAFDAGRSVGDLGSQPDGDGRRVAEPATAPVFGSGAIDAARNGDQRNPALRGSDAAKPAGAKPRAGQRWSIDPERDTAMQALAKAGGISRDEVAREFGLKPEELKSTVRAGNLRAFPFRAKGMGIDRAIETLQQHGYFDGVPEDGLRNAFEAAIFDELGGQGRLSTRGQVLQAQQRSTEHAESQAEQRDYEGLSPEDEDAARAEREAIMAEAGLSERDMVLLDDDVPLAELDSDVVSLMRALGYTDEEIQRETQSNAQRSQEGRDAGQTEKAQGTAAGEVQSADGTGSQAARPDATQGALTLTSPTREDLKGKEDQADSAKAADAAEQKRLAQRAQADAERGEFTLTGSDSAADTAAAGGQVGLFDQAPASTRTQAPDRASEAKPRPEALIELRKRESILKSLKECLG